MIASKSIMLKNESAVFSDWENKVYNTPEELLEFTKNNPDFYYEDYIHENYLHR